jgi:hypothetical protein
VGSPHGWLAGLLAALAVIAAAGTAAFAGDYSCANPIAPCTACHSPELARDLAKCLAEPWLAPATAKELASPVPPSEKTLRFGKATYLLRRLPRAGRRRQGADRAEVLGSRHQHRRAFSPGPNR